MSEILEKSKNLNLNSLEVHSDFVDTNKVVNITSTDNDLLTTGNLLNVAHTGNSNTINGPIVNISSTTTSTNLDSILKVSNTLQTSGNIVEINGKDNQTALNVINGNVVVNGFVKSSSRFQNHSLSKAILSDLPDDNGIFAKNRFYSVPNNSTVRTISLPSSTECDIGDFINIFYNEELPNTIIHTFKVDNLDDGFALSSTAIRIGGASASTSNLVITTDKKNLKLTGATNGDGGKGTTIKFVNVDKSKNGWAVEAITYNQGNGSTGGTITFE